MALTIGDGFSLPSRLMEDGRSRNKAVAITSQPTIIIIIMLNPPALVGSELGPGTIQIITISEYSIN